MSFRDQRVGTSHLDRVKEDVSQEYFTCRIISGCMHMTWTVMELAGKRFSQIIQWCRGGLRVAEKVSKVSKRNQYPLTTIYGQERK